MYLSLIIHWFLFYFLHSLLSSVVVKQRLENRVGGSRNYRLAYSIFSTGYLLYIVLVSQSFTPWYLMEPSATLRYIGLMFSTWGVIILMIAFRQMSALRFVGIKTMKNSELITEGIYRYMRHPLYSGTLLVMSGAFLYMPRMVVLIALAMTVVYLPIGIVLEERKLIKEFGDAYRVYKSQIGALSPWF